MVKVNDGMSVTAFSATGAQLTLADLDVAKWDASAAPPKSIEVTFGEGAAAGSTATIATMDDRRRVRYYSPMHGIHYYVYNAARDAWVSEADDHFLVEIMARDLVHYCKGLPDF